MIKIFKDEGISGGSELENRSGLVELFDHIENNKEIEGILIFKLDRLARDLYIQEHLIKKLEMLNIKLLSIKEPNLDSKDPMRKAFRQFMGIVSELEKAFITMRLSAGRINKAQKGGFAGGSTAMGYLSKNKELKIDREQAETIKNYLGGNYYFTSDEVEIDKENISLIEAKHTKESKLPSIGDIKDGLLKMILFTNLENVRIDNKNYNPIPILKLTTGSGFNIKNISGPNKETLNLLKKEAEINKFRIIINNNFFI